LVAWLGYSEIGRLLVENKNRDPVRAADDHLFAALRLSFGAGEIGASLIAERFAEQEAIRRLHGGVWPAAVPSDSDRFKRVLHEALGDRFGRDPENKRALGRWLAAQADRQHAVEVNGRKETLVLRALPKGGGAKPQVYRIEPAEAMRRSQ
jgi:hypothetical protein